MIIIVSNTLKTTFFRIEGPKKLTELFLLSDASTMAGMNTKK